jgi:hypothetical protein
MAKYPLLRAPIRRPLSTNAWDTIQLIIVLLGLLAQSLISR